MVTQSTHPQFSTVQGVCTEKQGLGKKEKKARKKEKGDFKKQ